MAKQDKPTSAMLRKLPSVDTLLKEPDLDRTYYWTVQAIDNSFCASPFAPEQSFTLTVLGETPDLPTQYRLFQNFPNPFNPQTTITFDLPRSCTVRLFLYNVLGEKVCQLVQQQYAAGRHRYILDATNLASGLYFYKLKADRFEQIHKMLIIK